MRIEIISENKSAFMDLLLLADEQESMVNRYLERGTMFALYDDDLIGSCVVTKEADRVYELKNLAVYEKYQGLGYGSKLVKYLFEYYKDICDVMYVGTGDSPITIPFYEKCGFRKSHRIKNFFVDNYDHPIYEDGKQLTDMIYLKKEFRH